MRRTLRDNGLLVANLTLFAIFFLGMVATGLRVYNADELAHGGPPVDLLGYLGTGQFLEATFENWESEFLQMGMYVVLTIKLVTRGSSESRPIDEPFEQDDDPRAHRHDPHAPWPVRRGGWALSAYEHSLSAFFLLFFAGSLLGHAAGGVEEYNAEQVAHGNRTLGFWAYLATSRFWFESFQNWQSEFLAVGALVGASVYLRQRGSPESKPVHAPHRCTGS